jgi:hypothetical protein
LQNPRYAGKRLAIVMDMMRLEWAHIEAWDRKSERSLDIQDLAPIQEDFAVSLQHHVQLLELHYPVDELRLLVNASKENSTVRTPRSLKRTPRFVVVYRQNLSVFYKIVSQEEFLILRAIQMRRTIADAIEEGLAASSWGPDQMSVAA